MKITKLLSTSLLALALVMPFAGCSKDGPDDDESSSDSAADATEGGATDIDCNTMCEAYTTQCIQGQGSTEFQTNDECIAACGDWDQEGINCRFSQIPDACDQAGNMGDAC
ncbi:hypothetical protein G6O69_09820 [Pseudenhygromyxa sp. WMMC2535]|uniref:hypothetical protein n=1 Tax=Pseudenhygromyxa sp. WMMC2535 TaxID=2712867 RepID=UPI0015552C6F|nr:hypothetical protein [Pseudenhygromyxa sp. WMMC2535]NVB38129.1 hypothetical protein [Pseudenhygromyxa sp. WMMC2535]